MTIVPNWVAAAPVSSPAARQISISSASESTRSRGPFVAALLTYSAVFASRMPSPASQLKYADIDCSVWFAATGPDTSAILATMAAMSRRLIAVTGRPCSGFDCLLR